MFDTVFGRSTGKPPSVMSLGIAVLDLLSLAYSTKPLLLLLDDGQWLDSSSVAVIGFAGRRLAGSSVKLVVALRSGVASEFDTAALPALPVRALPGEEARRLLDLRRPGLDTRVRRLVLDQARGNPLALLELPAHLHVGHPGTSGRGTCRPARCLSATAGAPASAAGVRHAHRVPRARRCARSCCAVRWTAWERARQPIAPGARAIAWWTPTRRRPAALLDIDPLSGDFVFRHPLARSTVVQKAMPNERRAAHAALAQVHRDDVERRAMHLAASTVDPDERVAAALKAAADSATRRGGSQAAVAWLTRAAELSESPEERSRRLGDAAFIAGHASCWTGPSSWPAPTSRPA
ncbi:MULTISPECIES: ATP-binding protein [Streptomyces violaceusniger group]|uniref:hypothetical protein n=1 Tax=Streptomyces violaceusniger group TaxID=2839105 RepID=UPI000AE449BF|nr:hypothetical protein [Streptomyces violaceusniger]